jgi:hypothetical protein
LPAITAISSQSFCVKWWFLKRVTSSMTNNNYWL